ncbi:hypothetical protein BN134_715 [Cronobacter dublinensis 1210]|uniref:Uncharacterized protein n=1 Tax=Cronobacter dublinensis 1210 TaxID=1208656 RepID=A0ABP1W4Z1_9ENTR|nr:hypothetical protein BN134_715 [Cronobacter dublinensis 1210]
MLFINIFNKLINKVICVFFCKCALAEGTAASLDVYQWKAVSSD